MKRIKGYENYGVSKDGRVYNFKHHKYITQSEHLEYLVVGLRKDGITKQFRVHRLVAEAYIPNPDNKPYVHHMGTRFEEGTIENKQDNRVDNLMWVTMKEHAKVGGHIQKSAVAKFKRVRLWNDEVSYVFDSIKEAATKLGINHTHISSVAKGIRKTTGGYRVEYIEE